MSTFFDINSSSNAILRFGRNNWDRGSSQRRNPLDHAQALAVDGGGCDHQPLLRRLLSRGTKTFYASEARGARPGRFDLLGRNDAGTGSAELCGTLEPGWSRLPARTTGHRESDADIADGSELVKERAVFGHISVGAGPATTSHDDARRFLERKYACRHISDVGIAERSGWQRRED
jgi:hypothetical protein